MEARIQGFQWEFMVRCERVVTPEGDVLKWNGVIAVVGEGVHGVSVKELVVYSAGRATCH